ncbi:putative coenzyme F420-dependent N5,N10-methylene tetrahydromethanopterin reductase [Trichinella spiralis]|uniref:putative coenzyme F420-dependent N5,N10-methylene tetrahydromethanopterin reductase n=1 Tax=Trichinella spiralis TaxID=6334 RepID=UPI0001EFEFC8|nr:putative coenzyme F420-dependent N5,N10-methylene tetrahydromethanopterin reductase [Trichinella spiralis]
MQLASRNCCFRTRSNAMLPREFLHTVSYASPDGSTRRSDLADRVTDPCMVFTVADLTTPSSLGWISMILPIGHLIHVVLGSCTSTMSPTLGS